MGLLSAGLGFAVSRRAGGRVDPAGKILPYKFLESYDQTRACAVLMLLSAVALPTSALPSELVNERFISLTPRAFIDL